MTIIGVINMRKETENGMTGMVNVLSVQTQTTVFWGVWNINIGEMGNGGGPRKILAVRKCLEIRSLRVDVRSGGPRKRRRSNNWVCTVGAAKEEDVT